MTGNTIGSGTGTGSVSVTTSGTGGTSFGIGAASFATRNIANNTIGSIRVNGTTTSVPASLTGISVTAGAKTISNNLVGSSTTANSLNAATAAPNVGISLNLVLGIVTSSSTSASITGNTVANLNNNSVAIVGITANGLRGIEARAGVNTITGNTVRNLSLSGGSAFTTQAGAFSGILSISTAAGQTVSQNTVHSLTNTRGTGSANHVYGIVFSGPGPTSGVNVISRNLVHSLALANPSATSTMNGILIQSGITVQNNQVRVGLDATGTSTAATGIVRGIYDNGTTAGRNFYHNSVYVGGTATSGAVNTFAFTSDGVSNARTFQNNIFVNARSNSGGTGKHYAVNYGGTTVNPTGLTAGGNIFHASGTGGVFGLYNSADVADLSAWQAATGQDATSYNVDPRFINPTGTAATVDLHLQTVNPAEAHGVALAAVTDDFDGQTRSSLTPDDIGADAGNFIYAATSTELNPVISYTPLGNATSTANRVLGGFATITDDVSVAGGGEAPRLYFKKSTEADAFVGNTPADNGWKYVTAGNVGSPYDFTVDYALLTSSAGFGEVIQYFVVAQDGAGNFASSPSGASYASAAAPVTTLNARPATVQSYRIEAPVGTAPTIAASATVSRQEGTAGSTATIAIVNDAKSGANGVTVTASAPTGISITGITNVSGTVTATVVAGCNAATGNNTVVLTATDGGSLSATANLIVNVTANSAPTVGTYADQAVVQGGGVTVTPSVAPADNGSIASVTVAAAPNTFTGSLSGDTATGIVTITNAAPSGIYTIMVTVTDNCGATTQKTFTLAVNAPPTITAGATAARQQGLAGSLATIATVSDDLTAAGALTVTQMTVPTGISVTNIVNTNGTITATVAADCNAALGNNTVVLKASDGSLTATANLTVNVTAHNLATTALTNQSVFAGATVTFSTTASGAGPYDFVWKKGTTVLASGISTSGANSSLTLSGVQASDIGTYSVEVTGACATVTKSATLGVTTPTLSINDVTLDEGNSGMTNFNFTVTLSQASTQTVLVNYATANNSAVAPDDYSTTSGQLTFAPGDTSKTITVKVIGDGNIEPTETFFVNLMLPTGAPAPVAQRIRENQQFIEPEDLPITATITDAQGLGTITNDDVPPFTSSLTDPFVCNGIGSSMLVTAMLTNPNNTPQAGTFNVTLPAALTLVPNTCTSSIGACTPTPNTQVAWSGNIPAGQTVTITYQAQIADGTPLGTVITINSSGSVAGVATSTSASGTVSCPGLSHEPEDVKLSDQKAGSLVVFPFYTSKSGSGSDTKLHLSNTGESSAFIHLFFIDGATCNQADYSVCLTPNASLNFLASEMDPDTTGWLMAVAVDAQGNPIQNNGLIGNAFVNDGNYVGNYGAESFWAYSNNLATINGDKATLRFNGTSYDAMSNQFAVEIQSPRDVIGQKIVTVGMSGDITSNTLSGAAQVGIGAAYNGNEKPVGSFSGFLNGTCQASAIITGTSPRVPFTMAGIIPSG